MSCGRCAKLAPLVRRKLGADRRLTRPEAVWLKAHGHVKRTSPFVSTASGLGSAKEDSASICNETMLKHTCGLWERSFWTALRFAAGRRLDGSKSLGSKSAWHSSSRSDIAQEAINTVVRGVCKALALSLFKHVSHLLKTLHQRR